MSWMLTWTLPEQQLVAIRNFYLYHEDAPMVKRRRRKNVEGQMLAFTRDTFIKAVLCCLCTSQQRSGPTSRVAAFFRTSPFPITESYLIEHRGSLSSNISALLSEAGLRFGPTISEFFVTNVMKLDESNWKMLDQSQIYISLSEPNSVYKLAGFGSKQARNLLQTMGVSQYEIPLDSRFARWLTQYGFPYSLKGVDLQNPALYDIAIESIKDVCRKIDVYSCLLDAAVFSTEDGDGWTEENMIF